MGCETYAVFEFAFTGGTFVSGCFLSFFVFRLETSNLSVFRLETANYYSWYFNWYLIKSKNIVCSFMHRIPTAFCTLLVITCITIQRISVLYDTNNKLLHFVSHCPPPP